MVQGDKNRLGVLDKVHEATRLCMLVWSGWWWWLPVWRRYIDSKTFEKLFFENFYRVTYYLPWQRSPGQSSTSHSRFAGHIGSSTRNKLFQLLLESLESNRYRRLFFVFLFRDLAKSRIRTFYYLPSFPCLWTEIFGEFGIIWKILSSESRTSHF